MDAWHPIAICNLWRIYHQHCWSMHNLETPGGTNNITQTNPYHQRHWIFFQLTFFFWIVKLTVSVVFFFVPTPTTTDEVDLLSPFLWGTALPGLKTRLQSRHGFIEPWFHCWSRTIMISLKRKTNQLIPIDGIQDQSFFSCKSIVFLIIQLSTVWMND